MLQVAAFRATLEEIAESSLLVHVVDIRYFKNLSNYYVVDDEILYLIRCCYQLQPSFWPAADRCCGQSSIRARRLINSQADGLEQGTLKLFCSLHYFIFDSDRNSILQVFLLFFCFFITQSMPFLLSLVGHSYHLPSSSCTLFFVSMLH